MAESWVPLIYLTVEPQVLLCIRQLKLECHSCIQQMKMQPRVQCVADVEMGKVRVLLAPEYERSL